MKEAKFFAGMMFVLGCSWLIFYACSELAYNATMAIAKAHGV